MTTTLARYRAMLKRRREARLAFAHARVGNHRQKKPLPQAQLELDDVYVSKREHDLRVTRQLQLEQASARAARIEAAHATSRNPATPPPLFPSSSSSGRSDS